MSQNSPTIGRTIESAIAERHAMEQQIRVTATLEAFKAFCSSVEAGGLGSESLVEKAEKELPKLVHYYTELVGHALLVEKKQA